jgi:hypothetical protein
LFTLIVFVVGGGVVSASAIASALTADDTTAV